MTFDRQMVWISNISMCKTKSTFLFSRFVSLCAFHTLNIHVTLLHCENNKPCFYTFRWHREEYLALLGKAGLRGFIWKVRSSHLHTRNQWWNEHVMHLQADLIQTFPLFFHPTGSLFFLLLHMCNGTSTEPTSTAMNNTDAVNMTTPTAASNSEKTVSYMTSAPSDITSHTTNDTTLSHYMPTGDPSIHPSMSVYSSVI